MHSKLLAALAMGLMSTAVLAQPITLERPGSRQLDAVGLTPPPVLSEGVSVSADQTLVRRVLGAPVISSTAADAETIGTISDLLMSPGGQVTAAIIGVGGFLGVGERDVAVDFEQLQPVPQADGTQIFVLATTTDALAAAPPFIWEDSEAARGPSMTPEQEQQQMVPGDPNAVPVNPDLTTDQPVQVDQAGRLDRNSLSQLDSAALTADQLRGLGVYGVNDELIGTVSDVIVSLDQGIDALIVDVGGFLGLGSKPVAVGFENLTFATDNAGYGYVFVNATSEQLEQQPAYDPITYNQQRDVQRMRTTP